MFRKILSFLLMYFLFIQNIFAFSWELSDTWSLVDDNFENINLEETDELELEQEEELVEDFWNQEIETWTWEIIDSKSSSEWQGEEEINLQIEEEKLISEWEDDGEYNSGSIIEETGSWNLDEYENRFKIVFQNPSYLLDKDIEQESYICDETKDECKVNFNIDDLELSTFSSKFYCEHDFWFITWEEEKCNPSTISFWTWVFDVNFKIFQKEDDSLIWEKSIEIMNDYSFINILEEDDITNSWSTSSWSIDSWTIDSELPKEIPLATSSWWLVEEDEIITWTGETDTSSWTLDFWTGEIDETWTWELIDPETNSGLTNTWYLSYVPDPFIEIQSWLNYLTWNIYECKKQDCKINLTAENSFSTWFVESDYTCLWSFSGWTFSTEGTENKCNPWYIDYWTWSFEVSLKIFEKENENNFKESFIIINNLIEEEIEIETWTGDIDTSSWTMDSWTGKIDETWTWDIEIIEENIIISSSWWDWWVSLNTQEDTRDIIIQSWLDYKNWTYICDEKRSKINLEFKDKSWETCLWDFWNWEFREKYLTTCNPWFIYYESWNHNISLEVYKEGELLSTKYLSFENIYFNKNLKNNQKPISKITLQWKLAKYKTLVWNKLICDRVEECSVNLTWEDSFDENKKSLIYNWDLGNWETFSWDNPSSIKYKVWNYIISLEVIDEFWETDISYFYLEVKSWKIEFIVDENIFSDLKISWVMPNNSWVDDYEWLELENVWNETLNLKWLLIDDIVWKWSKAYEISTDLLLGAWSKKRFYKSKTRISFWNTNDELNIIYDSKIIDSLKWDFSIPDNFILTHDDLYRPLEKVFVTRVVDGDTFDIKYENWETDRVRLIWVDTPETKDPRKPVQEFWVEAYEFTKNSLEWKYLFLEIPIDNRWKYGRLLAYAYIDEDKNISFNEDLIKKWYARAYLKYPFKYSEIYADLEKQAKKDKLWLWWNKDVLEVVKDWIEEDEDYLEELEQKELYDFEDLFLNWLNIDEIKRKYDLIWKDIENKSKKLEKEFFVFPSFLKSWQKVQNNDSIFSLVNSYEKQLKSSISYKISKQKKWLKITWNSKDYKTIIMNFWWKDIELKTDENWDFVYYTTFLISWDYKLDFYWLDENWKVYLKSWREFNLSPSYVAWVNSYKISTKNIDKKSLEKSNITKIEIYPINAQNLKVDKKQFPIILNLILWLLSIFWVFILFRRKKFLQID